MWALSLDDVRSLEVTSEGGRGSKVRPFTWPMVTYVLARNWWNLSIRSFETKSDHPIWFRGLPRTGRKISYTGLGI